MDKATIERLTQLTLAAQGKKTKRPLEEILRSEKSAAEKFLPSPKVSNLPEPPASTEESP